MKYMGSKRRLLENGLGTIVEHEASSARRFIDLFAGSAAVSYFAACHSEAQVISVDLQSYSAVLALAVTGRSDALDDTFVDRFIEQVQSTEAFQRWTHAGHVASKSDVERARLAAPKSSGVIARAYGGHYFGLEQARLFDAALALLPRSVPRRKVLLASIIGAASKCAAAPGHTAEPIAPSETGLPHIAAAWSVDPLPTIEKTAKELCRLHAKVSGKAFTADAERALAWLRPSSDDVVFIDPPYSAVQYSRFYHVFETIARGDCGEVSGRGRYPDAGRRPRSLYSLKTGAPSALDSLLEKLQKASCRVILTYPAHLCSNGLSGESVVAMAASHYEVEQLDVASTFSTLGGSKGNRGARQSAKELVIVMRPTT